MAKPDYAKTFAEMLWIANEATFNTPAYPGVTDALLPLPGTVLPAVLHQFTPSIERLQSAGVRDQIKRQKVPAPWSIPVYTKYAAAAGSVPSWGLLAKKGFGIETINAGTSVVYSLATDVTESSVTIWQFLDNLMRGFRGCVVNTILLELSGGAEGKLTFGGFALNEVFAGTTTLNGGIDAVVTSIVLTDSLRYQIGPLSTDRIRIQIDSEVMEVTAINYATHTLTVVRAQAGTAAAAHSNGAEVFPWTPGADTDPADTIAPMTLGEITLGALANLRGVSFTSLLDNKLEPRMGEYAQDTATGFHRQAGQRRMITGEFRAHLRQTHQALLTDLGREVSRAATIRSGDTTTARLTVSLPRFRFSKIDLPTDGAEVLLVGPYQAFESTVGNDEVTWTTD